MSQNVEFNIHQYCMEIKLSYYLSWLAVGKENDCENTLSLCKMINHDPPPVPPLQKNKQKKDLTQGDDIKVLRSYFVLMIRHI